MKYKYLIAVSVMQILLKSTVVAQINDIPSGSTGTTMPTDSKAGVKCKSVKASSAIKENKRKTYCIVTISTRPNPGATIKYQTVYQRFKGTKESTANSTTNCDLSLPEGDYYIWVERYGRITSDKDAKFEIRQGCNPIIIQETN